MDMKVIAALCLLSLGSCDDGDCNHVDMDVGGEGNACSYMPTIAVVAAEGEEKPEWLEGYFKTVHSTDMDSPMKCQMLCERTPHCDYWSYSEPDPHADCTLKTDYSDEQKLEAGGECAPLYEEMAGQTSGPNMCPSCYKETMDVGGGFNACGYMDTVWVYGVFNSTLPGWYKGPSTLMGPGEAVSAVACQEQCKMNPFCAYWHVSEEHCYLKADYTPKQKAAQSCEPLYQPFEEERPFSYSSGPKMCMGGMACQALKNHYRDNACCGNPAKMVAMP